MNWIDSQIDVLVPDDLSLEAALRRTTHLAIGAHADDLEVFAYPGIADCYRRPDLWFAGITVTDGAGSVKGEVYADLNDEDLVAIRREEQREAARIGQYGVQIQFGVPSNTVKDPKKAEKVGVDLSEILQLCRPRVVYLHSPLDRHPTHVAVFLQSLAALRNLPDDARPDACYGCEVWRDLDWLPENYRIPLDASAYPNLAQSLIGLYDSQISSGKRYDKAIIGRREANATLSHSHAADQGTAINLALDLMPLLEDPTRDPREFSLSIVDAFREDVARQFDELSP